MLIASLHPSYKRSGISKRRLPVGVGQEWRAFSRAACTICFMTNRTLKSGESREQPSLFPPRIEDYVGPDNPVRAIDSFVKRARPRQARFPACRPPRGGGTTAL